MPSPKLLQNLHWLGHDSFRLDGPPTIYFDPWKLPPGSLVADVILVSHDHYDHLSVDDVARVSGPKTVVIANPSAAAKLKDARVIRAGETITVAPMRTFPIIRDLVTDVSFNFKKAREIPAFKPKPKEADGTRRMFQEDIDRVQEFHKCIECFLCQNVCHVIRDHEENKPAFAGPRFFVRLASLEMHPLDANDRMELIKQKAGLGFCNITKCCTEVCPEHIHITDNAIIPLKERVVDRYYDPIAKLLGLFSQKK